jgi:hypothetical protein
MNNKKYLNLAIESFCLVIILTGLFQLQIRENISRAKQDAYMMDPNEILKKTKVQKLSGSVDDLDKVINDQLDAYFGKTSQQLYKNMSSTDAIKSAKENALGIFTPDQMQGSPLDMVSDLASMRAQMAESTFLSSASSLAAMNAKYMNDQTQELTEKMDKMNNTLTKWNEKMKDIIKTEDSMSSKLPKLAIK